VTDGAVILERVDALLPLVAEKSAQADRAGELSGEVIQAFVDAEVFATLAPSAYGGHQLPFSVYSQIVQRVSAVSPSAGWAISFLMGASWRLLLFNRQAQEEMFAGRNYILGAGAAAPIFGVEKVDGGYVLNGRTAWNSGSSAAEWFQVNGVLMKDGAPELLMFAVPRADVTILDTWHIMGMKGTASRDLTVEKVFVPEHRAALFVPALEGQSAGHRLHDHPMYHVPFLPFAMVEVLPVIVGTHRGAANALFDRTEARLGTISGAKGADKVPTQIRMAQGLGRARMAEDMLEAMIARLTAFDPAITEPQNRAAVKLHAALVTNFCLDSVNEMARSVGGDAFRDEAPFQTYFRDLNTVARHAFLDPDMAGESYGKLKLGLPVADLLI